MLPDKPVLITFDDGYQDNYDNAYPILRKYGLKGTVFVVTSFLGTRKGYLTWDECREMEKNGMTVASHTVDHKSMTDLTNDQLRAGSSSRRRRPKPSLGHEVKYMAYPTGAYNLHIAQLVREAGYKAAFTIKYGGSAARATSTPSSACQSSTPRRRTATSSSASITPHSSRALAGRSTELYKRLHEVYKIKKYFP